MITQQRLKELLIYSPDTGKFFWANKAELTEAGWISNGYLVIRLEDKIYKAHHLAWLYYYGELPEMLDHRDHCKTNNAIMNLRKASFNINNFNRPAHKNNKTGYKNISLRKNGKYQVSARFKGEFYYVGNFVDLELAIEASKELQNMIEEKAKLEVPHANR